MANISEVLRKFINAPEHIKDVVKEGDEYFFHYGTATFSAIKRLRQASEELGQYSLYFYPQWSDTTKVLSELSSDPQQSEHLDMIPYHQADLPQRAAEDLTTLYLRLQEKHLGADEAFDKILEL